MRDFVIFLRHFGTILHFARGILLSLAALLLVCVLVISYAEGLPLGRTTYFVLITALTIGYGDITPKTPLGAAGCVAAGVIGLITTGLGIAAAVRALQDALRERYGQPPKSRDE